MSSFAALHYLASLGLQPIDQTVWIGLGSMPKKPNGILVHPRKLPSDLDCMAVAGLRVILLWYGEITPYWPLYRLCSSLLRGRPKSLMLVDLDKEGAIFYLKGRIK